LSGCGLSSTGLNHIDANELTLDNITVFPNLNVSGYSFLNNVLINNNTTLLSSLNVSGFTTLNNKTSLLSSLNVSGFTTLNNNTTLLSSLNVSRCRIQHNGPPWQGGPSLKKKNQVAVGPIKFYNILGGFIILKLPQCRGVKVQSHTCSSSIPPSIEDTATIISLV
jgi:hypothetical protein